MLAPIGDVRMIFEAKKGEEPHVEIIGDAKDCAVVAVFMACRISALSGDSAAACDETRRQIVRSLDCVGPSLVEGMFRQKLNETEVQ